MLLPSLLPYTTSSRRVPVYAVFNRSLLLALNFALMKCTGFLPPTLRVFTTSSLEARAAYPPSERSARMC
jgi:hypothetical protein